MFTTDMFKLYKNVTLVNADILKTKHELDPDIPSKNAQLAQGT